MSDVTIRDLRNHGGEVPRRTAETDAWGILDANTVDPADFQDIDGLTVRSVPHPDAADTA